MKKINTVTAGLAIFGVTVPIVILVCCYKYNFTDILKELLLSIFTGCIIAVPNIILLLHRDRIEKNRIRNQIVSEFVKHYYHIDSKYFYTSEIGILNHEMDYLDSISQRLSYLLTDYYVSDKEKTEIVKFNRSCAKLRDYLEDLKENENNIKSETLDNRIKKCISCAKTINNYLNYTEEYD